jgi:hypothetical protein
MQIKKETRKMRDKKGLDHLDILRVIGICLISTLFAFVGKGSLYMTGHTILQIVGHGNRRSR